MDFRKITTYVTKDELQISSDTGTRFYSHQKAANIMIGIYEHTASQLKKYKDLDGFDYEKYIKDHISAEIAADMWHDECDREILNVEYLGVSIVFEIEAYYCFINGEYVYFDTVDEAKMEILKHKSEMLYNQFCELKDFFGLR